MTMLTSRAPAKGRSQNSRNTVSVPADPALDPTTAAAITAYVSELIEEAPALTPTQQREVRMLLGAAGAAMADSVVPTAA